MIRSRESEAEGGTAEHRLCLYVLSREADDLGNKRLLIGQKKPLEPRYVW
jgi:hypothetical protein